MMHGPAHTGHPALTVEKAVCKQKDRDCIQWLVSDLSQDTTQATLYQRQHESQN